MEPGTRFCPDHPDLRFPPFAQECSICNHPIETYPTTQEGIPISEPLEIVDDSPLTAEELEPLLEAANDLKLNRLLVSRKKKAPAKKVKH